MEFTNFTPAILGLLWQTISAPYWERQTSVHSGRSHTTAMRGIAMTRPHFYHQRPETSRWQLLPPPLERRTPISLCRPRAALRTFRASDATVSAALGIRISI